MKLRPLTFKERFLAAGRAFFTSTPSTKYPIIPSRPINDYRPMDYNPDALLYNKGEGLELYDRMMMDDVISGTMNLKKRLVLSADWEIREKENSGSQGKKIRDFVKEVLEEIEYPTETNAKEPSRPSFLCLLDNLLDARVYGFKTAVPRLVTDGGEWRYKSIICKPSYDIQFMVDKETDELEYLYIGDPGSSGVSEEKRIDPSKIVIFVWPYVADANWYGQSELGPVYREFFSRDGHYKFRNIHGQKFGSPTIVAEYRSDLAQEQIDGIKQNLDNWQDNLVIYIPSDWHPEQRAFVPQASIRFLESNNNGQAQYNETIEADARAIRRKLLVTDQAGFTDTKFGSRALGETQFANVITLDTRYARFRLADCINAQVIAPLVRWNFGPDAPAPKLVVVGDGEGYSAAKAEAVRIGKEAGIFTPDEPWVRPYAGVPSRPSDMPEQEAPKEPVAEVPAQEEDPENPAGGPVEKERMQYEGRFNATQARKWYEEVESTATPIMAQAIAEIARAASAQAEANGAMDGDWKKIEDLKAPGKWKKQIRDAYEISMSRMYFHGRLSANREVAKAKPAKMREEPEQIGWPEWSESDQFVDRKWIEDWLKEYGMTLTDADKAAVQYVRKYSFYMSGVTSQETVARVGTMIYTRAKTMTTKEIVALIESDIAGKANATAATIVRNNTSTMFNDGRMETYREAGDIIQGYVYDAILDDATTEFCRKQDGRYIEARNPMFARVNPPNHDNCRSVFVPVFENEEPPTRLWLDGLFPSARFGGKHEHCAC